MASTSGQPAGVVDEPEFEAGTSSAGELPHTTRANLALANMLQATPWSVRFFQMVRMLERLHPERRPVGMFVAPASEVARFSANTSLTFPASEIQSFTEGGDGPDRLAVNFMGLSTMNGPMPPPYTEMLLERARAKDHAAGEFFDIFNHRILSLFYRGWKHYRFYIAYEQGGHAEDDLVTRILHDLIGLGTAALQERTALADEALLYYGGLNAQTLRTAQGLQQILADYFQVAVTVEQFTGSWNRLPAHDHSVLNYGTTDSERLGFATILGEEVWDQQGTLTIRLGPMPLARYHQFLPGGEGHRQLCAWLRFYGRGEFDYLVKLVLERDQIPPVLLCTEPEGMARLGFASWIKNQPFTRDPDDTTFRLH